MDNNHVGLLWYNGLYSRTIKMKLTGLNTAFMFCRNPRKKG